MWAGVGILCGLGIRGGTYGPGSLLHLSLCSSWNMSVIALGWLSGGPSSASLGPHLQAQDFLRFLCGSAPAWALLLLQALADPGSHVEATSESHSGMWDLLLALWEPPESLRAGGGLGRTSPCPDVSCHPFHLHNLLP